MQLSNESDSDMATLNVPNVIKRKYKSGNHCYSFVKVVPKDRVEQLGGVRQIWISLETDDLREADKAAEPYRKKYEMLFSSSRRLSPADLIEEKKPKAIAKLQAELGLEPMSSKDMLNAEFEDSVLQILKRRGLVQEFSNPEPPKEIIAAAYGATDPNVVLMSEATDRYAEENPGKFKNFKPYARKRKIERWRTSIDDFIASQGDLDVRKITTTHAREFTKYLAEQVNAGEIEDTTARMKLSQVSMIVTDLLYKLYDTVENPFVKAKIEVSPKAEKSVKPFTDEQMVIVKQLQPSDPTIRDLMDITYATGAGMTELLGLATEDIFLDHEYPHFIIRPNKHRPILKTKNRPRALPLWGPALDAMKRHPDGFSQYRHEKGEEEARHAVNNMLKAVKIPRTWNGFRHYFEDALRNSHAQDSVRDEIMGHSQGMGGWYGNGLVLKNRYDAIEAAMNYLAECQEKAKTKMEENGQAVTSDYKAKPKRVKKVKLTPRKAKTH